MVIVSVKKKRKKTQTVAYIHNYIGKKIKKVIGYNSTKKVRYTANGQSLAGGHG